MKEKILIVEDQFIEAHDLQLVLEKAGYQVTGIARSVDQAIKLIRMETPDFVMLDILLKGEQTGIDLARYLKKIAIPFVYLSANSNPEILSAAKSTRPYGFLVKPFREKDVLVTLEVAKYHHEYAMATDESKSTLFQQQLEKIYEAATDASEMLLQIGKALQHYISFEYLSTSVSSPFKKNLFDDRGSLRIGFDEYQYMGPREMQHVFKKNVAQLSTLASKTTYPREPTYYSEPSFIELCRNPSIHSMIAEQFQVHSLLSCPVMLTDGRQFYFNFYSSKADVYGAREISIVSQINALLIIAVEKMIRLEITDPRSSAAMPSEPKTDVFPAAIGGMVGTSHAILKVFDQIALVAPTDTSVLLLGEPGTGKERAASCIHYLSNRRNQPLIKINCSGISDEVIESELFGHEKGAVGTSFSRRLGKLQLADRGTVFLDEIGELSIDLQVKLLRVLQDQQMEPIGARLAVKTNVRIIAASTKNLEKAVSEGRFRLDLYYRLFVLPIYMPALRERKEDIPVLVSYFTDAFNRKFGKNIRPFSDKILQKLQLYSWPGNLRELEHLIERTFLLTKSDQVEEIALPINKDQSAKLQQDKIKTILENERDHIQAVLRKCNGKVWGEGGAAELLNIPPSTLNSKIRKLGINKFNYS
jgi:DNA-binding NtrC family response regulator